MWDQLPGITDKDLDWLVSQLAPRVMAGQVKIATLTAADLAQKLGVKPVTVDQDAITKARGVSSEVLYGRPVVTARTELSKGTAASEALRRGKQRINSIVSTNLQMAKVRQADASLQAGGATKYRRVLSGDESCALCVIASTQRYHVGKLLPIHPGCMCDIEPIDSTTHLPQVIDPDRLEDAHGRVKEFAGISDRGGRAPDYRELIITHEHGEIGPVLGWRGQHFTSASDLPE
jgi:hypothetical protein